MPQSSFNGAGWGSRARIQLIENGTMTRLLVNGQPYMRWPSEDDLSPRLAIAQLSELGFGTYEEIAEAFRIHEKSVYNYSHNFSEQGAYGLVPEKSGPKGRWKLNARVRGEILFVALNRGILEPKDIKKQLDEWGEFVSIPSICHVLLENGIVEGMSVADSKIQQAGLFDAEDEKQMYLDFAIGRELSKTSTKEGSQNREEKPRDGGEIKNDSGGMRKDRSYYSQAQRIYLDQLERGDYNAYAGGLLFAPLVERYSLLPTLRRIITIDTYKGYSLEELCLTLFYLDGFGFRSMEDFKRVYPEEFGTLIGRSYSPSRFTLRRFLHKVRKLKKSETLIDEFAYEYLKSGAARWGVLYIDGHFLPYYGMVPITKGWHGVRKIPMKGSYNFLGVDENFTPWHFMIRSSSEDLLQKIPEMSAKVKEAAKRAGMTQQQLDDLIVIFDREGYSAELYRFLDGRDRDDKKPRAIFISWAKYADKWVYEIPVEAFDHTVSVTYEIQKAEEVRYIQTERTMSKYGKIRTIVIESGADGKRAAIYTNGEENKIDSDTVIRLICRRWGEENKIKELMKRHFIDYTPGYVKEPIAQQPLVNNPKVKRLKKEKARLTSDLHKLKVQLTDKVLATARDEMSWEQIKKNQIDLLAEIVKGNTEVFFLEQEVEKLPAKIPFDQAHGGKRLLNLNFEKKRFLDCIKLFSCNMQEQMCEILLNYYDKPKELMPALAMILSRGGYLKLEHGKLKVSLRRFKNHEIDYAARRLCEDLNAMVPRTLDKFQLPIIYEVL
jgi:transposase